MAYYDALVCAATLDDAIVVSNASILCPASLSQSPEDSALFAASGPCLASYYGHAQVEDTGWPKTESGGGTGETVEVTSVAILVDGTWRQAVGQQLSADGLWHAQ